MGLIFARATNATFTIFLSFVLSYIMLISMGILWPEGLDWLVQRAKDLARPRSGLACVWST